MVLKVVWVVSGVGFLSVVEVEEGVRPRAWAEGVWVRKAKVLSEGTVVVSSVVDIELLVSRFGGADGGCGVRRVFNRAMRASLRVFSAASAAWSFCVSRSSPGCYRG